MNPMSCVLLAVAFSLISSMALAKEQPSAAPGGLTPEEIAATPPTGVSPDGEIDWLALMPADEVKALEDMNNSLSHFGNGPEMSFTSERVVEAMNGVKGKLGGYIVPLNVDANGRMIDMFLVPYFGACIHMPPPPPNQIIYIKPKEPMPMTEIWDAYWIHGTLRTKREHNGTATAAYTMEMERFELIQ